MWGNSLIAEEKTGWQVIPLAVQLSYLISHSVHIYEESDKNFPQSCQDVPKTLAFSMVASVLEITLLCCCFF